MSYLCLLPQGLTMSQISTFIHYYQYFQNTLCRSSHVFLVNIVYKLNISFNINTETLKKVLFGYFTFETFEGQYILV